MSENDVKTESEKLNDIFESLSHFPDLLEKLMEAQKDYTAKIEKVVDQAKSKKEENGKLSEDELTDIEEAKLLAEEEFGRIQKNLLIEAYLRQQDVYEKTESELKKLRAENRRLEKLVARQEAGHKIYPNDPCPCGSGKKYKKCCGKN
jgi:uncharacterized protein YecA (UPF0149 family)